MNRTNLLKSQCVITFWIFFAGSAAHTATPLEKLFIHPKPIIAVINLPALPGEKNFVSMDATVKNALSEMKILEEENVDGVIFENPHGDIPSNPETIAAMTVVVSSAVKASKKIVVGVEVLWHDPLASLAIAKASNAKFIRTDFFADKMMADKHLIDEKPERITHYRTNIGADSVLLLTDIQVKYGTLVDANKTITQSATDAIAGKSDGVIVTGKKSGVPPDLKRIKEAKIAVGPNHSVILGSGTTAENIAELFAHADAAIVGTSISTGTGGIIQREKVRKYMAAVKEVRRRISLSRP